MENPELVKIKKQLVARHGRPVAPEVLVSFLREHAPPLVKCVRNIPLDPAEWCDLKTYSYFAGYYDTNENYDRKIFAFDPELRLPPRQSAEFIGDGCGESSLDSYRRVVLNGRPCFEKIYRRDSPDYRSMLFFYHRVRDPLAARGLATPALQALAEGHSLAAAYFDYLADFRHPSKEEVIDLYREAFGQLSLVTRDSSADSLVDFRAHALYRDGWRKAGDIVSRWRPQDQPVLEEYEALASSQPLIFSHGDWYRKNIDKSGVILDWDRCGFYPWGFDLAYCLSKSLRVECLADLERALQPWFRCAPSQSAHQTLWFFCFVFYSRGVGVKIPPDLLCRMFLKVLES